MAIETRVQLTRNEGTRVSYASSVAPAASTRFSRGDIIRSHRGVGGTTLMSSGYTAGVASSAGVDIGSVTVEYPIDDKIAFMVGWGCTALTTGGQENDLQVSAGTERRGYKRDQGAFTLRLAQNVAGSNTTGTTGAMINRFLVGPFETARFALESGSTVQAPVGRNYVRFRFAGWAATSSGSTGAQARRCNIRAFEMPVVRYAT